MLVGSQLNLGAQATNPAQFWLTGSASSMTGDIKSGQTVWVGGSASGSFTTFVVTNGFVNAGTLRLESADAGYDTLFYVNNGVLTNGPTGITAKSVG